MKLKLKHWIARKILGINLRHNFTKAENSKGGTTTQLKRELRKLETEVKQMKLREQIMMKRYELMETKQMLFPNLFKAAEESEESSENLDNLLIKTLLPVVAQKFGANKTPSELPNLPPVPSPPENLNQELALSEDYIRGIVDKLPKEALEQVKNMDNAQVRIEVKKQFPELSESSIDKIIKVIRE